MNVYEYAMKIERESEGLYRKLAGETDQEGLCAIFTMLADEAINHYDSFKSLSENDQATIVPKIEAFQEVKDIFAEMHKDSVAYSLEDQQIDFCRRAIKIEDNAYKQYMKKAAEATNIKHKEIFIKMAKEELKHKELLENILEYLEHPALWLESAEFKSISA